MNPSKGVQIQPAYILQARPFRETSLLLEVFSHDYGKISLVARGARRQSRGASRKVRPRFSALLQPFTPLLLSWGGRGSLFNLTHAEPNGIAPMLEGKSLKGGWYMNELLVRTLGHWDGHAAIFVSYEKALYGLNQNLAFSLRQFEKNLLISLGVLPQFDYESVTQRKVEKDAWYLFSPTQGITRTTSHAKDMPNCFQGKVLLAVEQEDWTDAASIRRLFRLMLDEVLSHQPVRSRDLL